MSEYDERTESFPDNVDWSHYYDFPANGRYSEKSIILSTREGLAGLLCGNIRILTDGGYCGWVYKRDVHKLPEYAHLVRD